MSADPIAHLLRQSGGFEGVRPLAIEANEHRLALPHPPEPGNAPINPRPGCAALSLAVKHRYHRVVRHARLLDLPAIALPSVHHPLIKPANPVMACVGVRIEDALRHIHLEVLVAERDDTFDVASIQPLIDLAHDLDVLLRHRPRSIALRPAARWSRSLGGSHLAR